MEELMQKLQAFFTPEEIEWRVGATNQNKTKGLALPYVTNRAIQNRLDEVFGIFGWKNQFREWKEKSQICGISVWDEKKQEWITKWDGADDSDMEGTKGGLSDSMKRAAYQWGIGRYLYKMPSVWVPLKQQGKSYVLAEIPDIPDEFLPEEYRGKKNNKKQQGNQGNVDGQNGQAPSQDTPAFQSQQLKNKREEIYEKAKKLGFSAQEMQKIMKREWGKEASKELTENEIIQLSEHLSNLYQIYHFCKLLKYKPEKDLNDMSLAEAAIELAKLQETGNRKEMGGKN